MPVLHIMDFFVFVRRCFGWLIITIFCLTLNTDSEIIVICDLRKSEFGCTVYKIYLYIYCNYITLSYYLNITRVKLPNKYHLLVNGRAMKGNASLFSVPIGSTISELVSKISNNDVFAFKICLPQSLEYTNHSLLPCFKVTCVYNTKLRIFSLNPKMLKNIQK